MTKTIITGTILGVEDVREVDFNGQVALAGYVKVASDGLVYYIRAWGKKIDLARQFIGQYADVLVEIIPRTQINQEKRQIFANCELKMTALAITKPRTDQAPAPAQAPAPPQPMPLTPAQEPDDDDEWQQPTKPITAERRVKPFGRAFSPQDQWGYGIR